ncbi:MAG: A/G-specific adenine glycosylase [Burkholderiaceae bacterium]
MRRPIEPGECRERGVFAAELVAWQRRHGRHDLPWQNTRDPYRVWLSEIMLQQTQVATVRAYYERFLERFPDVTALAVATLDEVLAAWSGLGYYRRARNLHRCAQVVVDQHGGRFPQGSEELAQLPGIGRSTAAAIAAFCFGERVAILDGNVKRVLTRVFGFGADLAQARHERELWTLASRLLPERSVERYTQGLMDLGATVCVARAPLCERCPVRGHCVAARAGTPERYPVKSRTVKRGTREHVWLWLHWREQVWLVRRPDEGVWAGLWSLPEFESKATFDDACASWPGTPEPLQSFTHTLTHLDWTLHPLRWTLPARTAAARVAELLRPWPNGRWFTLDDALAAGLPAPLRKLLRAPG